MKAKLIITKCHKVDSDYFDRDGDDKRTEIETRGILNGIDKECAVPDLEMAYHQALLELKDMKQRFDCNDFSKALKEFFSNRMTHADTEIFLKRWRGRWESYKNDPLKKLL